MKSLEEKMVSGDPVEMLKAQYEYLENIRKSYEGALEKLDESKRELLAQIEKMSQK